MKRVYSPSTHLAVARRAAAPAPSAIVRVVYRCVYCGNEVAVRDLQNGSDGACCGEVGHVERADER